MKIYAVIDTNVIISALLSRHQDTATVKILDHLYDRTIIPVYNDEILEEYVDVLQRPKFNFPDNVIKTTLEAIRKGGLNSDRIDSNEEFPDPKDVVFYEVAMSVEDSYLVTGNLKNFPQKSFIVSPAEMVEIINTTTLSSCKLLNEPQAEYGRKRH